MSAVISGVTRDATASPAGNRLGFAIGRAGGVVIVSVQGHLAGESGGGLEHILQDLICDQGNLHVVIDIKRLTHADPTGVSVLIDACRLASRCGATLTVRNPSEAMRRLLDDWCVDDQALDQGGCHMASAGAPTA